LEYNSLDKHISQQVSWENFSKHTVAKLLPSSSPPMNRAIAELVSPVISGAVPYDATSALDVGTCSGIVAQFTAALAALLSLTQDEQNSGSSTTRGASMLQGSLPLIASVHTLQEDALRSISACMLLPRWQDGRRETYGW